MGVKVKLLDYSHPHERKYLVNLLNEYAMDPMGGGNAIDASILKNLPDQLAARAPTAFSFIAYCNDKKEGELPGLLALDHPAGIINCFEGFSTFAGKPLVNVHDLYVGKEFRGKGIASALLQAAEQEAKNRGCCKMTLECLSGNTVALGAYKKNGFDNYELDPQNGHALFLEKKLK